MRALSIARSLMTAAVLGLSGVPAAAEPERNSAVQVQFGITGQVPVLCRVSLDATFVPSAAGRVSLGKMKEFCNSPTGYRVVMEYPELGSPAALFVDGRAIPLGSGGFAVVSQSPVASMAQHHVELELANGSQIGQIAFRIEPR